MAHLSRPALLSAVALAACGEAGPTAPASDTFSTGPELAVVSFEGNGAGESIPLKGTLAATVSVPESATILDVNVTVSLTHDYVQYLALWLESPDGTVVPLSTKRGADGDNYTGTVFDDEAPTAISAGTAPFTGSFQPEQPLSVLDGENQQGLWTLSIYNESWRWEGTLVSWSLEITNDVSSNPQPRTLRMGGVDTGVPDLTLPDGTTFSGLIAGCAKEAKNHGQFVQCVAHLANGWMGEHYISDADRSLIVSAAARSASF